MTNTEKPVVAIVEDDGDLARSIGVYLNGRGYEVELFVGYADAKQRLNARFQVAVIDLNLGDGDGMKLLQLLQNKFPAIKLIIMTGYDSLPKRLHSFALGADDYMKKPIFPSELEARIKRLLRPESTVGPEESLTMLVGLLTPTEERLLHVLLSSRGAPLAGSVLQAQLGATKPALYTCLSRLKKKVAGVYEIKRAYGRGWWGEKI